MRRSKFSRLNENIVYIVLWVIAFSILMVNNLHERAVNNETIFDGKLVMSAVLSLLPFFLLFCINNYLLIPRLLLRNRFAKYLVSSAACIVLFWTYQFVSYMLFGPDPLPLETVGDAGLAAQTSLSRPLPQPRYVGELLPMPLFFDFTYALLLVGSNIAIALVFQRFEDKIKEERRKKADTESRLMYLKAQINPHFYMNMLNNIHGMIEVDPAKAQDMVLDMSHLMRYMLYESSNAVIPLSAEVVFLKNYIGLMKLRFDSAKLSVSCDLPSDSEVSAMHIPPLLFLVFIENAFKHGVSYRRASFVDISVVVGDECLDFVCSNSIHPNTTDSSHSGIGLNNIRQRLDLLYGHRYRMEISELRDMYTVKLRIPLETNEHNDHADTHN